MPDRILLKILVEIASEISPRIPIHILAVILPRILSEFPRIPIQFRVVIPPEFSSRIPLEISLRIS